MYRIMECIDKIFDRMVSYRNQVIIKGNETSVDKKKKVTQYRDRMRRER